MIRAPALLLVLFPTLAHAVEELVSLALESGRQIEVRLQLPDAPPPHPVIMLFGGFKRADRVLELIETDAPVAWASFDYPYDPPRKFIFPYSLKHLPEFRSALHETFEGIEVLYRYLQSRSDIDRQRITIAGASAGAPFATISAADLAIPGLIIVHGFGQTDKVAAQQFIEKWEPKYGSWVHWPARWLGAFLVWYLDVPHAEHHAPRLQAQQQVLMVNATEDRFIPDEARETLWTALQQSQAHADRLDLPGAHLGSDDAQQIADILTRTLTWMKARGLM